MSNAQFTLTPAVGENFVGRKDLLNELSQEIKNQNSHIGFCLYGRRRIGKTSTLMELKHLLQKDKNIVVAYLSLYNVADLSQRTLANELINAITNAYQEKNVLPLKIKVKQLLDAPIEIALELLKNIKIQANVLEHFKLLFEYKDKEGDLTEFLRCAFNTSEVLAKASSTKCIVILDEFPEIINVENGLQLVKMLRTSYETQKRTSLIISGSIRKTLELVALSESSPFYKQLVPKHVQPFTLGEVKEFLKQYTGKIDDKEVEKLHHLTGGTPFYLQFIGRSTKYAQGSVEKNVEKFVEQEGDVIFKEEFEKLNDKEKQITNALAKGITTVTGIAKETNEPLTTIGRYLPMLMEKEVIAKQTRGNYELSDKLFQYWLKRKYAVSQ